jgi:hypothetical protein
MPTSRSVESMLLREPGDFLYTLKAGTAQPFSWRSLTLTGRLVSPPSWVLSWRNGGPYNACGGDTPDGHGRSVSANENH